ncbi:hypothetical protein B0H14DRAFT_2595115 [Mycena olivaceomarginata]|nr:hypothetical protein B0H14DRAFT_2595115 [Mycena olivaceomarginata]
MAVTAPPTRSIRLTPVSCPCRAEDINQPPGHSSQTQRRRHQSAPRTFISNPAEVCAVEAARGAAGRRIGLDIIDGVLYQDKPKMGWEKDPSLYQLLLTFQSVYLISQRVRSLHVFTWLKSGISNPVRESRFLNADGWCPSNPASIWQGPEKTGKFPWDWGYPMHNGSLWPSARCRRIWSESTPDWSNALSSADERWKSESSKKRSDFFHRSAALWFGQLWIEDAEPTVQNNTPRQMLLTGRQFVTGKVEEATSENY